jgi:hypothetical protein
MDQTRQHPRHGSVQLRAPQGRAQLPAEAVGMSGSLVEYAVWISLILVAALMGYLAGIRRRPSRHGSVQLRAPRNRR